MKLKSYILTIHLGEGDSDLQTALWVILGWFNDNASIAVKVWLSKILWFLISVKKGIQLWNFCEYYCVIMVLTIHRGGTPQSTSQARSVPAYIKKKALNPGKKIECSNDEKISWCTIWNPGFNMECGICVWKVGKNFWDLENTLCWYLMFAGSEMEKTRGENDWKWF